MPQSSRICTRLAKRQGYGRSMEKTDLFERGWLHGTYVLPYHQFGSVQRRFGELVRKACEHLCSQPQGRDGGAYFEVGGLKTSSGGASW